MFKTFFLLDCFKHILDYDCYEKYVFFFFLLTLFFVEIVPDYYLKNGFVENLAQMILNFKNFLRNLKEKCYILCFKNTEKTKKKCKFVTNAVLKMLNAFKRFCK